MTNEKVYQMSYAKIYGFLVEKAIRKERSKSEVDEIIAWLTGYSQEEIALLSGSTITYGDFFKQAPQMNGARKLIKGVVCGIRVETIEDSLMQDIRYLDKLVDELAKGKNMDKILRKECAL